MEIPSWKRDYCLESKLHAYILNTPHWSPDLAWAEPKSILPLHHFTHFRDSVMPAHDSKIKRGRNGWEYKVTLNANFDANSMYASIQPYRVQKFIAGGDKAHGSDITTGNVIFSWMGANGGVASHTDKVDAVRSTYQLPYPIPRDHRGHTFKVHSIRFHDIHVEADDCVWKGREDDVEWTCYFG